MHLDVEFVIADMQKLDPIADNQFDIIFATYPVWVQDLFEACRTWNRILKTGGKLLLAAEHPITHCISENKDGIQIKKDYNKPSATWHDTFDGTPAADRYFGGWSVDLPCVENFWRIADIINAICDAGFIIKKVYEDYDLDTGYEPKDLANELQMRKLPCNFFVLAIK